MDSIEQWTFFKIIFAFLDHEAEAFRDNLLGETLRWASGIGLSLLTLWILVQGYRIVTGQSHDSMVGLATRSLRSFLIVSVATSFIFGSTDVYRLLIHGLPDEITLMVTGRAQAPEDLIDKSLDKMQAAMIAIDALSVSGNLGLKDDQDRAQWFTGIGVAGPSVVGGALLLLYKLSLALFVGLGPVFVLSLLFDQTKQLFGRWLYYGLGTLFSLAVLSFMVAWTMKLVLAIAGMFATHYLLAVTAGASAQGVSSLAMQQGGVGLVMTVLLIMTPRMAAQFFQGILGDFAAFSAFGGIGRRREDVVRPGHVEQGQQPTGPTPTHAYRMPGAAPAQEDQIKRVPAAAEGSFLERYPNALAGLEGHGGNGDPLPASLHPITGDAKKSAVRQYAADNIDLVYMERMPTPSGGYLERPRKLVQGSAEYEAARSLLSDDALQRVATAANELGRKLEERNKSDEIETFNSVKSVAIEVNPKLAHRASYSAKAIDGMIMINPDIFLNYDPLKQNNRVAHEFRHLMAVNLQMTSKDYEALGSQGEDDAEDFAAELFGSKSK